MTCTSTEVWVLTGGWCRARPKGTCVLSVCGFNHPCDDIYGGQQIQMVLSVNILTKSEIPTCVCAWECVWCVCLSSFHEFFTAPCCILCRQLWVSIWDLTSNIEGMNEDSQKLHVCNCVWERDLCQERKGEPHTLIPLPVLDNAEGWSAGD